MPGNERGARSGLPAPLILFIAFTLIPLWAAGQSLPKLRRAQAPALPPQAAGGGEVLLELEVGADGKLERVRVLRSTPPYTELLSRALSSWSFEPAREGEGNEPVRSRVLVAGVFRAPELYDGTSAGSPPVNVDPPSSAVPVPERVVGPVYPALAYGEGVVILELEVDSEGQIRAIRPLTSGTGFEQASIDAARRWTFRPARSMSGPRDGLVVIVFGFRSPVVP